MHTLVLRSYAHVGRILAYLILLMPIVAPVVTTVDAAPQVQERFDKISDSDASATATHQLGFRYTDFANAVGSVSFEFCSNSPIPEIACVPPTGLDTTGASLVSQTGQTGFTISAVSTVNRLVIQRTPQVPSGGTATSTYEFTNVINPDTVGSYYVRIQTFSSQNGSGLALEDGGLVFVVVRQFNVTTEVPPYLTMCAAVTIVDLDCNTATSYFIDLGELPKNSPKAASSQMVAATNAGGGYSISLAGTTLTSGNNSIPPLVALGGSAPGTSQFGLNLRVNSNPAIGADPIGPGAAGVTSDYAVPNQFKFLPGDAVVSSAGTSDLRKFTVSYLTNVSAAQAAGVYATTVSFIALANF
jgi:hypothetical protein